MLIDWNPSSLWRLVTCIQICASLNHCKNKKADPCRLIPWKLSENPELFIFFVKSIKTKTKTINKIVLQSWNIFKLCRSCTYFPTYILSDFYQVQQANFSLAASFWGICLLSAFILLRWLKLAIVSIFHSYRPQRWRQVNQSQFIDGELVSRFPTHHQSCKGKTNLTGEILALENTQRKTNELWPLTTTVLKKFFLVFFSFEKCLVMSL